MKQLLLAEDDADLGSILKQFLELAGYLVIWKKNGTEALNHLNQNTVAACILDVLMPEMDGFALAEKITDLHPGTPFIFLTARNQKADRIKGLGLGADDYITKPFEVDELLLRLNNIIKRSENSLQNNDQLITIGKYELDCSRLLLHLGSRFNRMTELETKILSFLSANRNQLIKKNVILNSIWGVDDYFTGRSFDVFLSRIRKYLQEDPNIKIISIRNIGIEFNVD